MRKLARLIVSLIANALGLWLAATYLPGFHLAIDLANKQDLQTLAILAAILMALNMFLKPVLTLFFGPLIIFTLGLALIFINALILYILDLLSKNLTIDNVWSLIWATLIIGLINFIFHIATESD